MRGEVTREDTSNNEFFYRFCSMPLSLLHNLSRYCTPCLIILAFCCRGRGALSNDFSRKKRCCPHLKFKNKNAIEITMKTITYCFEKQYSIVFCPLKIFSSRKSVTHSHCCTPSPVTSYSLYSLITNLVWLVYQDRFMVSSVSFTKISE